MSTVIYIYRSKSLLWKCQLTDTEYLEMHKPLCWISARHLYKQIMITDDAQKVEFAFINYCLRNSCKLVEVECYLQVQQKQLDNINSYCFE
jgi:hypothetical protein